MAVALNSPQISTVAPLAPRRSGVRRAPVLFLLAFVFGLMGYLALPHYAGLVTTPATAPTTESTITGTTTTTTTPTQVAR